MNANKERAATVNGFWINWCSRSGNFVITWIKTGAEVGYKKTYADALAFALGCAGDRTGVTWENEFWAVYA